MASSHVTDESEPAHSPARATLLMPGREAGICGQCNMNVGEPLVNENKDRGPKFFQILTHFYEGLDLL